MLYSPRIVPEGDEESLRTFFTEELRLIAAALESVENIELVELHVAPVRAREGMIVLADGTNWDPGSGAGFYGYRGGSWNKLG